MKNTIRVERARYNISQSELADAVKVSRQTITHIELNKYCPSILLCFRIAHYFNMEVGQLFTIGEEDIDDIVPARPV